MSKMEYMPVDCLQVPKMLFQVEEFKNLSNTAKILYSLFLDRLKFAVQNGWVDHNGDLFVVFPKRSILNHSDSFDTTMKKMIVSLLF